VKAALDNQFVVTYQSKVTETARSPSPRPWRVRTSVLANPGTLASGVAAAAAGVREGQAAHLFQNAHSRMLIVILVVAASSTFAGAIVLPSRPRDDASTDRLKVYTDEAAPGPPSRVIPTEAASSSRT